MIRDIIDWLLSLFNTKNIMPATPVPARQMPPEAPTSPVAVPLPSSTPKEPYAVLTRRTDDGKETLGDLIAYNNGTMHVSTLELGWHGNAHDISCIPVGIYQCSIRPFRDTSMYQVLDVPDRTGVFIHPGNFYTDILGCILLGVKPADINGDGEIDVTASQVTVGGFMQFMGGKPFTLKIQ